MKKNIILLFLATMTLSGCGVIQVVADTTGKVVGAGFLAAVPNQGSDEE